MPEEPEFFVICTLLLTAAKSHETSLTNLNLPVSEIYFISSSLISKTWDQNVLIIWMF